MSALLRYGVGVDGYVTGGNCSANIDDSIQPADYRRTLPGSYEPSDREQDVCWPRARMLGADYSNIAPIWDSMPNLWEWPAPAGGNHSPKTIAGITRDASGSPIGSVTVLLFNTATDLLVDTVVSDATGAFKLSDPNNLTCFIVGYLAGSPDTTGATKNNLTGV